MTPARTIAWRAAHAFKLLIDDLSGRPLLGAAWVQLVTESPKVVDQRMRPAWRAVIAREIRAAVEQERARCCAVVEAAIEETKADLTPNSPWMDVIYQIKHPVEEPE